MSDLTYILLGLVYIVLGLFGLVLCGLLIRYLIVWPVEWALTRFDLWRAAARVFDVICKLFLAFMAGLMFLVLLTGLRQLGEQAWEIIEEIRGAP